MNLIKSASLLILITISFLYSCEKGCIKGDGPIVTQTIQLSSFDEVELAEAANVIITQGPIQEVRVSAQQNVIDHLNRSVSGSYWSIDLGNKCFSDYDMTVYITVPNMKNIRLSGSGSIIVNEFSDQTNLYVGLSGSGNIDLNQINACDNLTINISGSGIIDLLSMDSCKNILVNISGSGDVNTHQNLSALKTLDIKISGSGSYVGFPAVSENCIIKVSGSGDCKVNVINSLNVNISGSGNVYYKGNPSITQNISGSGNVINAN